MIRFGGPLFGVDMLDPDAVAEACRRLGYGAIYCPDLDPDDERACRDYGEANETETNLQKAIGRMLVAELVGARCCVDIAGSFHPSSWHGADPRNVSSEMFEAAVENARRIIDAVKPRRAKFTYEMMQWAIPDSPDSYLELIRRVLRETRPPHRRLPRQGRGDGAREGNRPPERDENRHREPRLCDLSEMPRCAPI